MEAHGKRYIKEFGSAMAAYAVLVFLSIWLLRRDVHSPLRALYALLPVVPAGFALWAAVRFFRGLDELQRRIQFEAVAFSFLATCLITLTYGFLQNAGFPPGDWVWVAPMMIILWGFGLAIAARRYE